MERTENIEIVLFQICFVVDENVLVVLLDWKDVVSVTLSFVSCRQSGSVLLSFPFPSRGTNIALNQRSSASL